MDVRHARILTALVAAIILHALLLSWPFSTDENAAISHGPLYVDLLKNSAPAAPKASPPDTVRTQPDLHGVPSPNHKRQQRQKPVTTDAVMAVQKASPVVAVAKKTQAPAMTPSSGMRQVHQAAQHVMAEGMQSMLLANIHYPAQARRHGWQGVGEFQLDITSQSIRAVTMLVSTGHTILDRAVHRGLARIDHVPVADGQYLLPVEFRLQ